MVDLPPQPRKPKRRSPRRKPLSIDDLLTKVEIVRQGFG